MVEARVELAAAVDLERAVISRRVRSPLAPTVSTATMAPPARVIAAVTFPRTLWVSSTRSVSENCALVVDKKKGLCAGFVDHRRGPSLRTKDRGLRTRDSALKLLPWRSKRNVSCS